MDMINLHRGNCDKINKYEHQVSKLTSAFHTFASDSHYSKRVTNQSLLKKRTGKKIKVQPEAVKRRKTASGSKTAIQKGMMKHKNPFTEKTPSLKRTHSFSKNVENNEAVSKKAGRTMASKTKFLSPNDSSNSNTIKQDKE